MSSSVNFQGKSEEDRSVESKEPAEAHSLAEWLDDYYVRLAEMENLSPGERPISMLTALEHPSGFARQISPESLRDLSGHLKRVSAYARLLASKYRMDEAEADFIAQICPMHDIGKWAIPEHILDKAGELTPEEWAIMKTHARAGYEMLKNSKHLVLRMGAMVAMQHQEKFDGSGYPDGLKGEDIHIYSRIVTVADVFDALGSERPYKQAWGTAEIVSYFRENRGTHFDPALVGLLLDHLDDFLALRESLCAP